MNAGAAPREEAAHRGVLAGRREQLDPAAADEDGRGLDTLLGDELAVLEGGAEGLTYVSTATSRSGTATPT